MVQNLPGEVWKDIENSKHYAISNYGRVKRLEHKKWCKPNNSFSVFKEKIKQATNCNTKKYWRIQIYYSDGSATVESVHRLVAKAFIPNPTNLPQVNHIDGNKDNNCVENLEWCDSYYNMQHSWNIGLRDNVIRNMEGEKSHLNKYPEEIILKIPSLVAKGKSYKAVASELGIPRSLINEIRAGRCWRHLNLTIPDSPRVLAKKKAA